MKKVNLITWDLVKKEFNLYGIEKGQTINILSTIGLWIKDISDSGNVKVTTIKAR